MKSTDSSQENSGEIFRAVAPVSENTDKSGENLTFQSGGPTPVPVKPAAPRNDPYGTDNPHALDIRASSSQDCTGLIPALPESDAALESYAELYHYPADIFQG